MSTGLLEQLRIYGDEFSAAIEPLSLDEVTTRVRSPQPLRPSRPKRRLPAWAYAVAAAVFVLVLVGGVGLLGRLFGTEPTSLTSTTTVPTTTTVPQTTTIPSTTTLPTTTTVPATTTVPTTTTTTVAETTTSTQPAGDGSACPGAERGFACPPDLPVPEDSLFAFADPGTYRTKVFTPAFEFTQDKIFQTAEELSWLVYLEYDKFKGVSMENASAFPEPFDLQQIADHICAAQSASISEGSLFGHPATVLEFTAACRFFMYPTPAVWESQALDGMRTRLYLVQFSADHQLLVGVWAVKDEFDRYFEETAQPLLDTVVFIDE